MKHRENELIRGALENVRCIRENDVPGWGTLTVYATRSGLVAFVDHNGGWTMFTECPSNSASINGLELLAMISGEAGLRPGWKEGL